MTDETSRKRQQPSSNPGAKVRRRGEGTAPTSEKKLGTKGYQCGCCREFHSWEPSKYVAKNSKYESTNGLPVCVKVQRKEENGDCFYATMLTFAKAIKFGFPKDATNDRMRSLTLRKDTSNKIDQELYERWMSGRFVALSDEWGVQYALGLRCVLDYTNSDGQYVARTTPTYTPQDESMVCRALNIRCISDISEVTVREFCMAKSLVYADMAASADDAIKALSNPLSEEEFVRWVSIQPSGARGCDLKDYYYWGDEMALEIASKTLKIGFDVIDPYRIESPLRLGNRLNPGGALKFGTISLRKLPGTSALHYEPVRYKETEGYVYETPTEFIEWAYKCENQPTGS